MPSTEPIIDTNITLGQWPTRHVPCDDVEKLCAKLHSQNVTEAWAGHYDALFHTDLTAVNNRLSEACGVQKNVRLVPFGEINPLAPNWEAELDRCATVHHMPGIRLHPNYHNFKLDDPNFAKMLKSAAERKLIVQLTVLMEDVRMMHPLVRVPLVDIAPLEKLIAQTPTLRLILLNSLATPARTDQIARLISAGEVYVEIAMLETLAALEALVKDIPLNRILFGSHSPSFYFESAALKLQESNLPAAHYRAITHESARHLLPTT